MKTEILLDHEPVADGGYLVRALLRITGEAPEPSDRPGLNLAVVLDRSGSMAGEPLKRAKEAAGLLVRRLADDDVVSVVAYDEEVRTVAGRTPGARRQDLLDRIEAIHSGGTTNLSGGWLRGRELVAEALEEGGVNRVLLLTDGLANVGITDPEPAPGPGRLRGLEGRHARPRSASAPGTTSTCCGPWPRPAAAAPTTSRRRTRRRRCSSPRSRASWRWPPRTSRSPWRPLPSVDHATVLHQYPRQQTDDGSLRLELGDLYALEPKSLLCEFLLSSDDDAAEVEVATLTVEGHVLLPERRASRSGPPRCRSGCPARPARWWSPRSGGRSLLLEAARAREEALQDRTAGAFEDGARKLRSVADKLSPLAAGDPELTDEVDDLRDMADRFEEARVSMADAKYMHQRAYS